MLEHSFLYKTDMRKTWGAINDTLQSNRRSKGQSEYIFGNRIIRDADKIANHFNDYFIDISRTLSQQIQPVHSFDHYVAPESLPCLHPMTILF